MNSRRLPVITGAALRSQTLRGFAVAAAPAALILCMVACSGATETGLFAPAGSSEFASEPGGSSGNTSNGGNGSSSSTSGASMPPPSSGEGSTSSGSSSSSSSSGGSTSSSSSSGSTPDASVPPPPPPAGKIYCGGGASCAAPNEICCINGTFLGGTPTLACEPAGLIACVTGRSIACDDSSDCPSGQVCCGILGDQGYGDVECKTQCRATPGTRAVRFCDPNAAVDECAAIGRQCGASQQMPGYHVCI